MSYWNIFTNLLSRTAPTSFAYANPFAIPACKTASLFTLAPKYSYSATRFTYPTYSYATPKFNFNFSNIFSGWKNGISSAYKNVKRWASNLGGGIVSAAKKYLGYNERNGSYKLFTGGKNHAWCADFSTYVVKEAFRNAGKSLPSGFGSSSVSGLMNWAKSKGCFLQTSGIANKSSVIKGKVKAGDLIIFKNAGKSHVGVVESIGADGRINTIEGNTSNKVARRSYSANDRTITGFAQIA